MTNKTVRALAAALLIGAGAATTATFVATAPAVAAVAIKTPAVAKLMKEAQAAAKSANWRLALEKAQAAEAAGPKGGEGAVITQFIAYAATNAGAYGVALNAYDKMIAQGTVNRAEGLKTAMRLALRAGQPAKALQYAQQMGNADPEEVAQIYYQQGNYAQVIKLLGPTLSGNPSKDALILLQNSYYKTHNQEGTQRVLEMLALHYPTSDSWHEIIKLAQHSGAVSDRALLEFYRMRLTVGDLTTHEDYFEMAEISMSQNLAAEAKAVLDKGVAMKVIAGDKDQRLITLVTGKLAQSAAAEAQLRQQASANPSDGNADLTLAEMLWTEGKFADAEQAARRAIKEGNLRDPDLGKIVLGHALLSQGKRQDAAAAFAGVSKDGKLASVGHLWSLLARAGVSTATQGGHG